MWTIAAANKKLNGPLGSYNGLTDVHLAHYFSTPARLSHLKDAKLITDDGIIVPEQKFKVESLQYEKKKKVYDFLAKNVIQNASHKEGSWNKRLFSYLEDISKMENVENIKDGKWKSGRNKSVSLHRKKGTIAPAQHYRICEWIKREKNERNMCSHPRSAPSSSEFPTLNHTLAFQTNLSIPKRCFSAKDASPYGVPLFLSNSYKNQTQTSLRQLISASKWKRKKKLTNLSGESSSHSLEFSSKNYTSKLIPSHQNLNLDRCKVTIFYYGHRLFKRPHSNFKEEIIIKQQHCGGTPVTVYKGDIAPNEAATFLSLTHEGFSFSITVFIDGIRYLKLSSCCVFRYPTNKRLGGASGNFSIQSVEGGKPCLKNYRKIQKLLGQTTGGMQLFKCQYREVESCRSNLKKKLICSENTNMNENSHFLAAEDKEKKKELGLKRSETEAPDSENSIVDKEDYENSVESEVSIRSEEEDIVENLSPRFDLQDTESEDQILEENLLHDTNINSEGESNYDSESSVISIAESVHDDIKPDQFKGNTFQSESSSGEENGKEHLIMASIHGSPS